MSTHISWFNLQNSLPYVAHEQNNSILSRNNENSVSFLGGYSLQRQQQSRSMCNFQAMIQKYFGKNENILSKQDKLTFQNIIEVKNQGKISNFSPQRIESQSQIQQSSQEIMEFQAKKGLKSLAKLLIRILKKNKFDSSSKYLTGQIQQILMKGKKLSKNQYARQSKNIRRRTYDALNVMIAANVLGPDLAFVKKINTSSFIKKEAFGHSQKKQIQSKVAQAAQKLQSKKQFLSQLESKKSALEWWINKRKSQFKQITQSKQQQFNSLQNFQSKNFRLEVQKIDLPVIFIHQIGENSLRNIEMKSRNQVIINFKNQQIKLFSEIDSFLILKIQQQMKRNYSYGQQSIINSNLQQIDQLTKDKTIQRQEIFQVMDK